MTKSRRSMSVAPLALVALVCAGHFGLSASDEVIGLTEPATRLLPEKTLSDLGAATPENKTAEWEAFEKSGLFVEPFDKEGAHWLPTMQLEFQRMQTAKDGVLYREILLDAIANKDKFASGTRLILKWGPKLILNFINARRAELQLKERREPKPAWFTMLASLVESVVAESERVKKEKGYNKKTVNVQQFRMRVDEVIDHYKRIIDTSPLGAYLSWDKALFYKDQPQHPRHKVKLTEEAADLMAQFRGIGYQSSAFFAARIVNLLRMFGRGELPSSAKSV